MDEMKLFRRRSSVDLGRYKTPLAVPVAPVSQVVDEGTMITRSAVRMTVKNRMIVAALRDGLDYDHARFMTEAAAQFTEFAVHEEASAERVRELREQKRDVYSGSPSEQAEESVRREHIHAGLAFSFRELALDLTALDAILTEARNDALTEMARHLLAPTDDSSVTVDESYLDGKNDRIAALLFIDLSELAESHGTSLAQLEEGS